MSKFEYRILGKKVSREWHQFLSRFVPARFRSVRCP